MLANYKEIRKTGGSTPSIIVDEVINPGYQVTELSSSTATVVLLEVGPNLSIRQLPTPPGGLQPLGSYADLFANAYLVATNTELLIVPPGTATQNDPRDTAKQRFAVTAEQPLLVRIVNDPVSPLVEIFQMATDLV